MRLGQHHSKEAKQKVSEANRGKPSWNKGVPMSDSAREKLSIKKRGVRMPIEVREKIRRSLLGRPSHWKGKTLDRETREKMSKAHLGVGKGIPMKLEQRKMLSELRKGLYTGDKNPNWRGGLTEKAQLVRSSIEYQLWRQAVFSRDGWTCMDCGVLGGDLEAHHIVPFSKDDKLQLAIDNGVTLCKKCHKLRHKKR